MRNVSLLCLTVFLASLCVPTLAFAHEGKAPLAVVEELAAHVDADGANFDNTNDLYKAAKDAIAHEAEEITDEDARPAAKRYAEIQPKVADAMRRNELPGSAWLMGLFGATLLWGGLAFCIGVARKAGKEDPLAE